MLFKFSRRLRVGASALLAATLSLGSAAHAGDDLSTTALTLADEDVAFFSTSVNLADGWNDFANSRFVQRLQQVPYIQRLIAEGTQQWNNPAGPVLQAKQTLESPLAKQLMQLGQEMFSDEIFVYGDAKWTSMIRQFVEINNRVSYQMAQDPDSMEEFVKNELLGLASTIEVPTTVMGFRVEDTENAMLQLNALDGLVRMAGFSVPDLQPVIQKLQRSDLEEGLALSLTLDTSLIPIENLEGDEREIAEAFLDAFGGRRLILSIGVKDGMLLLASSEEEGIIDSLGQADSPLLNHEALAKLREAAPTRLRSVAYTSADFKEAAWRASMENYCKRMTTQMSAVVKNEAGDKPGVMQWMDDIERDAAQLDTFIMAAAPNFGATVAWSAGNDVGAEGYAYDFTTPSALENASPLSVANHAGSNNLLSIAVMQAADSPQAKQAAEYILDAVPRHVRSFIATAEQSDEERARIQTAFDRGWPLILEAIEILETKIAPSMDRRQSVLSLAGSWMVDDFGPDAPPLPGPMPLPELALACELDNSELFLSGCSDLYAVFDKMTELVKEIEPNAIPADYSVPRPSSESIQGGKRFFYEEWASPVPISGFLPQVAVTESAVVIGYSERQVDDMLSGQSKGLVPAWVGPNDSVAAAWTLDIAGFTSMIRPWAEFGILSSTGSLDQPLSPEQGPIPTGNDVLQIWDCLTSLGKFVGTAKVLDNGVESRWVWIEQ